MAMPSSKKSRPGKGPTAAKGGLKDTPARPTKAEGKGKKQDLGGMEKGTGPKVC